MVEIIDVDALPDTSHESSGEEDIEVTAFLRKELDDERQRLLDEGGVVYLGFRTAGIKEDVLARITSSPKSSSIGEEDKGSEQVSSMASGSKCSMHEGKQGETADRDCEVMVCSQATKDMETEGEPILEELSDGSDNESELSYEI